MNGVWLSKQYCARFFLTTSDLSSNYLFVGDVHMPVPSTTRLEQHLLNLKIGLQLARCLDRQAASDSPPTLTCSTVQAASLAGVELGMHITYF